MTLQGWMSPFRGTFPHLLPAQRVFSLTHQLKVLPVAVRSCIVDSSIALLVPEGWVSTIIQQEL